MEAQLIITGLELWSLKRAPRGVQPIQAMPVFRPLKKGFPYLALSLGSSKSSFISIVSMNSLHYKEQEININPFCLCASLTPDGWGRSGLELSSCPLLASWLLTSFFYLKSSVISHWSPGHKSSVTIHKSPATSHKSPVIKVTSHKSLVSIHHSPPLYDLVSPKLVIANCKVSPVVQQESPPTNKVWRVLVL